jgi:uncharacterized protein YeeX (DUF496 family)
MKDAELKERLAAVREMKDENRRAYALVDLARQQEGEFKGQVLEDMLGVVREMKDWLIQAYILEHFILILLKADLKKSALDVLRTMRDEGVRANVLADVIQQFGGELKGQVLEDVLGVVREIQDEHNHDNTLKVLAKNLLKQDLEISALAVLHSIKDEGTRAKVLADLITQLKGEIVEQVLGDVLGIVHKMKGEKNHDDILRLLIQILVEKDLKKLALEIAREIRNEVLLANILVRLAWQLKGDIKNQVFEEALDAAHKIQDEDKRVSTLADLGGYLEGILKEGVIDEVLAGARGMKDWRVHDNTLNRLVQILLEEDLKMLALEIAHEIKSEVQCIHVLIEIAQQLDGDIKDQVLEEALATAHKIQDKDERVAAYFDLDLDRDGKPKSIASHNNPPMDNPSTAMANKRFSREKTREIGKVISFTAYHPKEGSAETWYTLMVYVHALSALAKVQEDAKRFDDQIKSPKETSAKSFSRIQRGTELTIVPSCKGVTFNPEQITFKWIEDFHRTDFRFKADKSLSGDAAKGSIDIYVGPLIIGSLKFAMLFNNAQSRSVTDHEERAKMYGADDVFISYSRKDTEVARVFKTILSAMGMDVFLDVDNLKSGQLWQAELAYRIKRARIFQIFWSENYSQSNNCKMEWKYALKQNKDEGYIRPVYWEKPLYPKPPDELSRFNFKYVELNSSKAG